jgi:hypothetical protein
MLEAPLAELAGLEVPPLGAAALRSSHDHRVIIFPIEVVRDGVRVEKPTARGLLGIIHGPAERILTFVTIL